MPFIAGERSQIVEVLKINREYNTTHGPVARAISDLEYFDIRNQTDYVEQVQSLLVEYAECLLNKDDMVRNPNGIKSVKLYQDYELELFSETTGNENYRIKLEEIAAKIRAILDPFGDLVGYGNGYSLIVEGL